MNGKMYIDIDVLYVSSYFMHVHIGETESKINLNLHFRYTNVHITYPWDLTDFASLPVSFISPRTEHVQGHYIYMQMFQVHSEN